MNRQLRRLTAGLLILSIAGTTQAGVIGHSIPSDRERIAALLNREDVAAELVGRGITPQDAKARVAALTDTEAAALAGQIDALPAGGFVQVLAALGMVIVYGIPILIGAAALAVVGIAKGVGHLATALAKGPTAPAPAPAE